VALSDTLQLVFEVTEIFLVDPEAEPTVNVEGDTDNDSDVPDWVTVTVDELTPEAENVTVALLVLKDVFALLVVTVTEPFPEPLVGETVSHVALSDTLQLVLEVTEILSVDPEDEPTVRVVGDTDRVGDVPD